MAALQTCLQDQEYVNWTKAGLCLAHLKGGLESFALDKSREFHKAVLECLQQSDIPVEGNRMCDNATVSFNGNYRYTVQCGHIFCDAFIRAIIYVGIDPAATFMFQSSNLANSNLQLWHNTPWELAKLFMNPGHIPTETGPVETELSGVINFLDRCRFARKDILYKQNIIKVRMIFILSLYSNITIILSRPHICHQK